MMRLAQIVVLGALLSPAPLAGQDVAARFNDYPTVTRADYVFACMATNGQSREVLEKCACSIDEIAAILPYDKYVEAETVLSMRRVGGERMEVFRSVDSSHIVADLKRAQAEAEMVCF